MKKMNGVDVIKIVKGVARDVRAQVEDFRAWLKEHPEELAADGWAFS